MDKYPLPTAQTKQTAVDIPTIYKRGPDSIYPSQADNARVHSPNTLRMRSFLNRNLPSTLLASAQPTYDPFEESISHEEDAAVSQPEVRYRTDS